MKTKIIFSTLLFLLISNITNLKAQEFKIAAIVGDKIITQYDIDQRTKIILLNVQSNFNEEEFKTIKKQITETLISETQQLIDAENSNLSVPEEAIEKTIQKIIKDNNLSQKKFYNILKEKNIDINSLKKQISASLRWQSILINKIRPTIKINKDEIQYYLETSNKNFSGPEYLFKTIKIPFTDNKNKKSVKELAYNLYNKIKKGRVSFEQIMENFNSSKFQEESNWQHLNKISPDIGNNIKNMNLGTISKPIKTEEAYYIIKLIDKRILKINGKNIDKESIYEKLFLEKMNAKSKNYLEKLSNQVYVERF